MTGFVALTNVFVRVVQGEVDDPDGARSTYQRWFDEVASGADGWLTSTGGTSDTDVFISVEQLASEQAARLNDIRPEQARWWEEMRRDFAQAPTVHDARVVATIGPDRPQQVGSVHVVQGSTPQLTDVMEKVAETAQRHIDEHHLDVIGGLIADHGDGEFTELIYYPSTEAARQEDSGELAEGGVTLVERLAGTVTDLRYLHLPDPVVRHH
ncbi:MAG TPA: hypothetical protein VHF25_04640 [Nitriliruptorales bacterium]|nr:hypothetical protein [Nitriliruptorales bacterium]